MILFLIFHLFNFPIFFSNSLVYYGIKLEFCLFLWHSYSKWILIFIFYSWFDFNGKENEQIKKKGRKMKRLFDDYHWERRKKESIPLLILNSRTRFITSFLFSYTLILSKHLLKKKRHNYIYLSFLNSCCSFGFY